MKIHLKGLLALALGLNLTAVNAQPARPGGMGGGPRNAPHIGAAMAKLFGEHQAFTAEIENEVSLAQGRNMTLPGKLAFDSGKARFEMNMAEAKGDAIPPQMLAQMKAMGMDKVISISRPDQKTTYLIYPGMKAYAAIPNQDQDSSTSEADYKIETTELGKETIDGHPCIKNKAVVTDPEGKKHESTLWNATDLKKFPVQIKTSEDGNDITLHFKTVKLTKPAGSEFDLPSDFTKYDSMMSLMQHEMMKHMQNGMPSQHP